MSDVCLTTIEAEPRSGAWNMAVDEAMLEACIDDGRCRLRLYRWNEPTISLGYFQKLEDRPDDPALAGLPNVRRLSGGGAILHDREWTYSIVVPREHRWAPSPTEIYTHLHRAIVDVLRGYGIPAELRGRAVSEAAKRFLCFVRGDAEDVVLDGFKIVGSAQRRRRGVVLQHGSLILAASEFAPTIPGVENLRPDRLPAGFDLGEDLERALAETACGRGRREALPGALLDRAAQLCSSERTSVGEWRRSGNSGLPRKPQPPVDSREAPW